MTLAATVAVAESVFVMLLRTDAVAVTVADAVLPTLRTIDADAVTVAVRATRMTLIAV